MKISELFEEVVKNFKPFVLKPSGYNDQKDWVGGTPVFKHEKKEWHFTGKVGKRIKNGKQAFEYEAEDKDRVWVTVDGEIYKD